MAADNSVVTVRIHIFDDDDDDWYDLDVSSTGDPTADWFTETLREDVSATQSKFTIRRLFVPPGPAPLVKWNSGSKNDVTVIRYGLSRNGLVQEADRIVQSSRDSYNGNIATQPGRAGRIEQLVMQGTLDQPPEDEWPQGQRPNTTGES